VGVLLAPELMRSLLGYPSQDPVLFGTVGSVCVVFGILSILGFFAPLQFVPILLLQLIYTAIWFTILFLPIVLAGQVQMQGWILAGVFASTISGDLGAILFSYLLS
jgi:hypothetical protein